MLGFKTLISRGMHPNTSRPFSFMSKRLYHSLSLSQGKLPDASEPRVVSPGPGLPGRVSTPPVPGSCPDAAEDGPADPGETPLPLHWHATRRQGQVSFLLCVVKWQRDRGSVCLCGCESETETENGARETEKNEWNKIETQRTFYLVAFLTLVVNTLLSFSKFFSPCFPASFTSPSFIFSPVYNYFPAN